MISAPSHLRLLSGSKIMFFAVLIFSLGACKTSKKAVVNTAKIVTPSDTVTHVDTVIWKEDVTAPAPIESDEFANDVSGTGDKGSSIVVPDTEKKEGYNVSVLFPFYSDSYNIENERSKKKSLRAIQLYAGMQLAIEKLQKENVNINFNIADTKGKTGVTESLLRQSETYNADLIFGPFRSDNLKLAAKFAKENKKPIVSPMNPSTSITEENPYFVQLKPSFEAHCQAITDHIVERYSAPQVVLVARNKSGEKERLQMFQDCLANNKKAQKDEKFREYLVSDYGNEFENMDFTNYFIEGIPTVFVVPSWSSESFINNVLRKIRLMKGENEAIVYGMPQWQNYERVSYDDYEALQVHISSDNHLDKRQTNIQNFAKAYFYKFGESPNQDAYFGYDMTLHLVRMMIKNGTQFQTKLDMNTYDGLASKFDFQTTYDLSDESLETAPVKFIENRHVDILQFKDFIFQLAEKE